MNRSSWMILLIVLLLVGGASGALSFWKTHQKLGKPGVRVVSQPIYDSEGSLAGTNSIYLPERVLDYSSKPLPVTSVELGTLPGDTTYGRRLYESPEGFETSVSVVLMGTDRTSIHKPQYCLTGLGLRIDESELTTIPIQGPQQYNLPVMKLTATGVRQTTTGEKEARRVIYVYWFVADGELTADHYQRMWWMARDLVRTGILQRWAYASCLSVCAPGQEENTYERMKQFIAAAVPTFQLTSGTPSRTALSMTTSSP